MHLTPDPLDLPGPRRFFRRTVSDIDQVASMVIAFPSRDVADLMTGIIRSNRRRIAREVTFVELDQLASAPVREILDLFGLLPAPGATAGPRDVVDHPGMVGRVLWVGTDHADEAAIERWFEFLCRFDEAAKARNPNDRMVIVTSLAGEHAARCPAAFVVRWWWGVITRLDTATYVEDTFGDGVAWSVAACAVEIAKFDVGLVDALLDAKDTSWYGDTAVLGHLLKAYAAEHSLVCCPSESSLASVARHEEPPAALRAAWTAGSLERWDGGVEAHAAARALEQPDATAGRILWQGQLGTLLPQLEARRRRLALWVAARSDVIETHGLRSDLYEEYDDIPIEELEIGPLVRLIWGMVRLGEAPDELKRYAVALREARNDLAHFSPIPRFRIAELDRYAARELVLLF